MSGKTLSSHVPAPLRSSQPKAAGVAVPDLGLDAVPVAQAVAVAVPGPVAAEPVVPSAKAALLQHRTVLALARDNRKACQAEMRSLRAEAKSVSVQLRSAKASGSAALSLLSKAPGAKSKAVPGKAAARVKAKAAPRSPLLFESSSDSSDSHTDSSSSD